ncbi:glycosyl hydrolase [Salinimicrobium sp. 3283s]|uniref:glycoside hydrolase family 26 protein n=1 Tax=Salinimicrobium sp. 3283s TaxID=3114359 RepID=UPI0031E959B2
MKRVLLYMFMSLIFASCSKDEDPIQNPDPIPVDPVDPVDPPEEKDFVLQPEDTKTYMVDASATEETVALFYRLKNLSRSNFIVGQQDAFNAFYGNNAGDSDIKKLTGSDPGLLGSDFMFITDKNNNGEPDNWFYQQEQQIIADAVDAYNKGMVNHFTWHLREPYEGDHFYTDEMTDFQKANAFKSILPGGANHEPYKEKLQKIAEVVKNLKGSDGKLIPIIFRPFHEFDGGWFWWGAPYSTAQEFKTLWQFTVDYLKDELNVHNILYAYAPDNSYSTATTYLQRYPGDEYVDILGMDNYGDFVPGDASKLSAANAKLKMISELAKDKVKIAAMTETGLFIPNNTLPANFYSENLYEVLTNNDIQIGFMMFWQNSENLYTVPVPGLEGEEDFLEFVQKEEPLLLHEMPDMYKLPN